MATSMYGNMTPFLRHFHVAFDVASCLLKLPINICTHPRHTTLEACLSLTCYCKHVRQALQQRARFVGLQANFLHVLALYLFQILHSFTVLIILLNLGYSCCQQGQARYFCKRKLKVAECTLVYIRKRPRDMSQ